MIEAAWTIEFQSSMGIYGAGVVIFETGRVADLIVEEANKWGADLIVMGTHGRRGLRHAVLGSDAEAVMQAAKVPVLLVRYPGRK